MKDNLFVCVFIALCACVMSSLVGQSIATAATAFKRDTIKIGGGFGLTGEMATLDLPAAQGAELAIKELNASGGVNGKQLELVIHDSQSQLDVTSQICKQFVDAGNVVAVVGFTDTDSVLACGPIVQNAGLPFITAGATSPQIPQLVGDTIYLSCFGDNVQAAVGAEFGFKKFGKNAYLLWDISTDYTTLLAKYFKDRFNQLGGTIALEDTFDNNATDYSSQIEKLKALPLEPDFYFISAMPYNVGEVVKQLRTAGLMKPIVGGDGYDTPEIITVAGKASNNVYFTTHALIDDQEGTAGIKRFMAAYKKEFGHEPENAFAALGYDTIYLLAAALGRAGSTKAPTILQALRDTKDFPGITGKISYSNGSHIPHKGVTLIAIRDGKFTFVEERVPEVVPTP